MKTIGILSALCLCTMQLWGPFTAAAQVNPLQVRLGSHLLGSTVKNPQGKDLGSIKDLVISPEDNRVVYAVLSFGGVLGLGEKAIAMPLRRRHLWWRWIRNASARRRSSIKTIGRR